jgi:putative transcriptional regulator
MKNNSSGNRRKNQGGGKSPLMLDKSLTGAVLVAMPHMQDTRFSQAVIYICGHDEQGAMGVVINKPLEEHYVADLLVQLDLNVGDEGLCQVPVYLGGPVEMGRGFILHSHDYKKEGTLEISCLFCLSATLEILVAMGEGQGPRESLCALGYAGWASGQLEAELQENTWLVLTDPDEELVFRTSYEDKWMKAFEKIGVHPELLSFDSGHA